jgi:1-deoxy-D-xylulose-5-phosphate synthase
MVADARVLADALAARTGASVGLVNARFAKPIDGELLTRQAASARLFVTLEDGAMTGGFGSAVLEHLADSAPRARVLRLGWPDRFVGHASDVATLRAANDLSPARMLERAEAAWAAASR